MQGNYSKEQHPELKELKTLYLEHLFSLMCMRFPEKELLLVGSKLWPCVQHTKSRSSSIEKANEKYHVEKSLTASASTQTSLPITKLCVWSATKSKSSLLNPWSTSQSLICLYVNLGVKSMQFRGLVPKNVKRCLNYKPILRSIFVPLKKRVCRAVECYKIKIYIHNLALCKRWGR